MFLNINMKKVGEWKWYQSNTCRAPRGNFAVNVDISLILVELIATSETWIKNKHRAQTNKIQSMNYKRKWKENGRLLPLPNNVMPARQHSDQECCWLCMNMSWYFDGWILKSLLFYQQICNSREKWEEVWEPTSICCSGGWRVQKRHRRN